MCTMLSHGRQGLRFLYPVIAAFLSGCYTQFVDLSAIPDTARDSVVIDSITGKTTIIRTEKDTVYLDDRKTCFWQRTMWGTYELRCYDDYFPAGFHSFYNRPWWYNDDFFFDPGRCHCPHHIIYNPNCEYCWYVCRHHRRPHKKDTLVIIHDTANKPPVKPPPVIDKVPGTGQRPGGNSTIKIGPQSPSTNNTTTVGIGGVSPLDTIKNKPDITGQKPDTSQHGNPPVADTGVKVMDQNQNRRFGRIR